MARLGLLGALVMVPAGARAHGSGAAITGVLGMDPDGTPWLLRLTEGLAVRRAQGFEFVCPAASGLDAPPRALAVDGRGAWVVGHDGLQWLTRAGALEPVASSGLDAAHVLQLGVFDGLVVALALTGAGQQGSAVFALRADGPELLIDSDRTWTQLATRDGLLWLLRVEERQVLLAQIGQDGVLAQPVSITSDTEVGSVRLREAGGTLFLSGLVGTRRYLARAEAGALDPFLEATVPLHGPVAAAEQTWVAVGNDLHTLGPDDRTVPAGADVAVTGLGAHDGVVFAAALGALFRLPWPGDAWDAPLLTLDGLAPPASDDPECEFQWLRFEADLLRAGYEPGTRAASEVPLEDAGEPMGSTTARGSAGGCRVWNAGTPIAGGPWRGSLGPLLFALALLVRRIVADGGLYIGQSRGLRSSGTARGGADHEKRRYTL